MIYVIGIGSGEKDSMTFGAWAALEKCDVILGYRKYVELIRKYFPEKIFREYSMREEIKRCEYALKISRENPQQIIGLISSGDSGIYGMAGLILELADANGDSQIEIKIIAGVSASSICASILGAPLMNDYVVLSLSDLLTGWEIIERRIRAACLGDFVICVFNPVSKSPKRRENFRRACEIMLEYKTPDTPCGFVPNGGRYGESCEIMTLSEIADCESELDMFCTLIIGNSQSRIINGKFVTRRGYDM